MKSLGSDVPDIIKVLRSCLADGNDDRPAIYEKFRPRIGFLTWSMLSLVPTTSPWLQGKCARINLSQAASGMILQNYRRLPVSFFSVKIVALGSLKFEAGYLMDFKD
jgi:hypothetical protein